MIWIGHRYGQRISKYRLGLLEPDAVNPLVVTFLVGIPGEPHLFSDDGPSSIYKLFLGRPAIVARVTIILPHRSRRRRAGSSSASLIATSDSTASRPSTMRWS